MTLLVNLIKFYNKLIFNIHPTESYATGFEYCQSDFIYILCYCCNIAAACLLQCDALARLFVLLQLHKIDYNTYQIHSAGTAYP